MQKKICSILLVDSDQSNAALLSKCLKECGHSVLTARDGAHALSILEYRGFEVLIVDAATSRIDGYDLMQLGACPRVIAMGSAESPELERSVIERGASIFLEKPVDFEELRNFLSQGPGRSSFSGMVEGVDIVEYVQFIMLGGRSTILEVTSSLGTKALLYISDGQVLHAVCGILKGEPALYRCLRFMEGTFSHLPWREPEEITIDKPGEFILMEAVRKRDEAWSEEGGPEN